VSEGKITLLCRLTPQMNKIKNLVSKNQKSKIKKSKNQKIKNTVS
jgi:hypothetical protein